MTTAIRPTNALMSMVATAIKEIAVVELFDGVIANARWKLAVDHEVPLSIELSGDFKARLMGKMTYTVNNRIKPILVYSEFRFDTSMLSCPLDQQRSMSEALASQAVANLKTYIETHHPDERFIQIPDGDNWMIAPKSRRIWIR